MMEERGVLDRGVLIVGSEYRKKVYAGRFLGREYPRWLSIPWLTRWARYNMCPEELGWGSPADMRTSLWATPGRAAAPSPLALPHLTHFLSYTLLMFEPSLTMR
jgi:hypothetical protein